MSGKFEEIMQRVVEREVKKEVQKTRTEILMEGRLEGRAEGETNGLRKAAKNMLEDGSIPISKISEFSGLSMKEIENIRKSIQ